METLDYLPKHKEIKLYQNHDHICINTDTEVLGEFLEVRKLETILDIGTNNGALLLYASRFNPKKLIGIEINKDSIELAKKNLELNKVKNYELLHTDAKTYIGELVDVIVCNPPYFKASPNKKASEAINTAKHDDTLDLESLIKTIYNNLKDNGKVYMSYQTSRLQEVMVMLKKYNLAVKEVKFVYGRGKKNSCLVLLKAVKNSKAGLDVKLPEII